MKYPLWHSDVIIAVTFFQEKRRYSPPGPGFVYGLSEVLFLYLVNTRTLFSPALQWLER